MSEEGLFLVGYSAGESANALALSPDGGRVVVAGCSPAARIWPGAPGAATRYALGGDVGAALAAFSQAETPQMLPPRRLANWEQFVNAACFSADGARVYLGLAGGEVELWDVEAAQPVAHYRDGDGMQEGELEALAVSSGDGLVLAAGDCPGRVVAWDSAGGACLWQAGAEHWIYALALSPDGGTAAAGTWDAEIHLWDAREGRPLPGGAGWTDWGYPYRGTCFFALAFSPKGQVLAAGGVDMLEDRGYIYLLDPHRWACLGELPGHEGGVHALAFSPDGAMLASGGKDGVLRLWDVARRKEAVAWDLGALGLPARDEAGYRSRFSSRVYSDPAFLPAAIHTLAFAPDGTFVVVGTDSGAVLGLDVPA